MNHKVKTRTSYTLEDGGNSFELPLEINEYTAQVMYTADGQTAIVGALSTDDCPEDPFEMYDEGEFFQFNSRYKHDTHRPDVEDWKRIVRQNKGRVVTVDRCGEGYSAGTLVLPADCRGDRITGENSRAESLLDDADGYYIAPEDATNAADYAAGAIAEYSAWCEGDVYGVCVWTYHKEGDEWELDEQNRNEVWGHYGYDYAKDSLDDEMKATFDSLNKAAA